jgi:hypothetical protein
LSIGVVRIERNSVYVPAPTAAEGTQNRSPSGPNRKQIEYPAAKATLRYFGNTPLVLHRAGPALPPLRKIKPGPGRSMSIITLAWLKRNLQAQGILAHQRASPSL